jgi:hypothetical protein
VGSGHVFVRDPSIGNVILSSSTGDTQGGFDGAASYRFSAPAIANDVAFMVTGQPWGIALSAVDEAGLGETNWTFSGDTEISTAPVVAGGLVFLGSGNQKLYALDASTGATSWSTILGFTPTDLAASNGTVVVIGGSHLVAYRTGGAIDVAPSNQSSPRIAGPADLSGVEAADVGIWSGLPSAYAYQWELCDSAGANCADIDGATGATYAPPPEDVGVGATLRVRVVATNDIGSSAPVESAPSASGPLLLVPQSGGGLRRHGGIISRMAAVGQELSTTDGIWTDDPTSYAYKWQRCDSAGLHCSNIAGATSSLYTVVSADTGYEIRSEVRAANAVGPASTYAPSTSTSPVGGVTTPEIVDSPAVGGMAWAGSQLSTTTGTWMNGPTSYAYRWQRCDNAGLKCVNIPNATSSLYTLVAADAGYEIRSEVLASNAVGPASSGYAPSVRTTPVLVQPKLSSPPVVSGKAGLGQQLSTTTGVWTNGPTGYQYKWQRCDTNGSNCVSIPGAHSSQYTLVTADVGHRIRSMVLADNVAGAATAGYAPSAPTAVVVLKPVMLTLPKLSGIAKVANTLLVTTGTWQNSPASYAYQWLRCNAYGLSCKAITGATHSSYKLVSADVGHKLKAKVTASNAAGYATALSSLSGVVKK